MGLGIVAMLIGLGTAGAGAYLGTAAGGVALTLPAGVPTADPGTISIALLVLGGVTTLLGAVSILRSHEH